MTTALIADDEPLLREHLARRLQRAWPELNIVAQARNGREALELFDEHQPQVVFLDVHMPGMNGIEAARGIGARAQIVFVTAYERYAVQAFEQGAIDYLVKPLDDTRLASTVQRLKSRVAANTAGAGLPLERDQLMPWLEQLAQQLQAQAAPRSYLQWIKASVGQSVQLIAADQLVFLRSDEKYTLVVWDGGEALIRKPIRELADELDPASFVQIHRSVIVALARVARVVRGANETAELHLHERREILPVSRSYLHLFRQM